MRLSFQSATLEEHLLELTSKNQQGLDVFILITVALAILLIIFFLSVLANDHRKKWTLAGKAALEALKEQVRLFGFDNFVKKPGLSRSHQRIAQAGADFIDVVDVWSKTTQTLFAFTRYSDEDLREVLDIFRYFCSGLQEYQAYQVPVTDEFRDAATNCIQNILNTIDILIQKKSVPEDVFNDVRNRIAELMAMRPMP